MSIFEFHYHELDSAIDERIERSNNIRDEWGTKIFDSEGRLRSSEDFPLEEHTLLGIIQYQQEQITDLVERYAFVDTIIANYKDECRYLKEDQVTALAKSVLDDDRIKCLTVSDGINSSAIEMLLERVKALEKDNGKHRGHYHNKIKSFNSDISSLDIRIERLEKEVEKL